LSMGDDQVAEMAIKLDSNNDWGFRHIFNQHSLRFLVRVYVQLFTNVNCYRTVTCDR
jgi:hypothetical protein